MRAQLSKRKQPLGKPSPAVKKSSSRTASAKVGSKKAKPKVVVRVTAVKAPKTSKSAATKATPKSIAPKPIAKITAQTVAKSTIKAVKPITKPTPKKVGKAMIAPISRKTIVKATSKIKVTPVPVKATPVLAKQIVTSIATKPKALVKSKATPTTTSAPRRQTSQAIRAFEQAVKVFNLRQFSEAKHLFEELQKQYFQEVEIVARSQMYIQVCNGKLTSLRNSPRDAEEFYDRGVVALNVGNFSQARTFFEKALKLRPDDSYTLYSLAATHAQSGAMDQALSYLEQAVQKQPRLRHRALHDSDFSVLKEDRRFLELLGAASPFDLLESRRDVV